MKKGLTLLIIALIALSVLSAIGIAAAEEEEGLNVEVESTFKAVGIGVMERELLAQSEWGYKGQRLREDMYSKYMGTVGPSNISFSSDLYLYAGANDLHENESTTEIAYSSTAITTSMKRKVCSQNYEAGVMSGVRTDGVSAMAFEIGMLPDSNYIDLEGSIQGSAKFAHMVRDPATRLKVVDEKTYLKGIFDFEMSMSGLKLVYPGDEGDWLGCP